jgi:undecaprenyl diphosphate synthase
MATAAPSNIPQHVAIIMDGNGRWAKQRGYPRLEGHRRGAEAVRTVIDAARDMGVKYLTLYAFSVENWRRPQDEVGGLMKLLEYFLDRETSTLLKNQVRLKTIGRTSELPEGVRTRLENTIKATAHFTRQTLVLALNYGSRSELLDALKAYGDDRAAGKPVPATPTWEDFSRYLNTAQIPDPDLIIRTSGEQRVSNFLLLQAAYAEFIFSPVLWPDFTREHFAQCLADFARRERRFGLTSEQVAPPAKP